MTGDEREAMIQVKIMAPKVARSINMLEGLIQEGKSLCSQYHWNDEVFYQLEEAATQLGFAMATLLTWDDDDPLPEGCFVAPTQGMYTSSTVVYDTPEKEE